MTNLEPYRPDGKTAPKLIEWIDNLRRKIKPVPSFMKGAGSPEGVVTAPQCTRYFRTDGSAGTWMYIKTTTSGNTGWLAYA